MVLVESQYEIAYQLLISASETIANIALKGWKPSDDDILIKENCLYKHLQNKLSDDDAKRIALARGKKERYSKQKFIKFLKDNIDNELFKTKDDLWVDYDYLKPGQNIQERYPTYMIIKAELLMPAKAFLLAHSIGPSTQIPAQVVQETFDHIQNQTEIFPPIGWFERVVQNAIMNYVRSQLPSHSA